jgi:hypothetical protein
MTCLFFSFLLIYKTRPIDFDLQLGCCISHAFSESFDPDDPALIDRFPDYTTETDLGERPPTPTQQWDKNSKRKACKKKKNLSAIPDKVSRT